MELWSKHRIMAALVGAGAVLGSTTGCELATAPDRSQITGGGGAGGDATGGGGATTTTGECAVAEDCPDPGNECLERACVGAACVPAPVASGTAVAAQVAGDCQRVVCDGSGATTGQADDADLPVDGAECTDDVCTAGVPSNPALAADAPCGTGGMLYCDGAGECVGCTVAEQCGSATDCSAPACNAGTCETTFTAPGTPIPMQTEGDCLEVQCDGIGGTKIVDAASDIVDDGNQCTFDACNAGAATHPNAPSGTVCADGGVKCDGAGNCIECLTGADCPSFICASQVCIAATCMDSVKNGAETAVDCGGADCAPCVAGDTCLVAGDCDSSVCAGSPLKCQAASCLDTVKNGAETDVDCGGGDCAGCTVGDACLGDTDCAGNLCTGNTCQPTCTDGVQNGTETGIDCGGSCTGLCGFGSACVDDGDCLGGSCVANLCAATCTDTVKNGAETDVDCGGGTCATCAVGDTCGTGADCASGACTAGVCDPDSEPANNTCGGATLWALPANITPLKLPNLTDVDWFQFTASAADVGKVVHVITQSPGSPPCDTVVEVFEGATCATSASLGGESDDANYSENWVSTPITAAGPLWVKVSYSTYGFSTPNYTLVVTLE